MTIRDRIGQDVGEVIDSVRSTGRTDVAEAHSTLVYEIAGAVLLVAVQVTKITIKQAGQVSPMVELRAFQDGLVEPAEPGDRMSKLEL